MIFKANVANASQLRSPTTPALDKHLINQQDLDAAQDALVHGFVVRWALEQQKCPLQVDCSCNKYQKCNICFWKGKSCKSFQQKKKNRIIKNHRKHVNTVSLSQQRKTMATAPAEARHHFAVAALVDQQAGHNLREAPGESTC